MGAFLEVLKQLSTLLVGLTTTGLFICETPCQDKVYYAISSLSSIKQNDYITVKVTLVATYHVSEEKYRKKVFNTGDSDAWFRD